MSKYKGNNLFDVTYKLFSDFQTQVEGAVKTYLPNIVPSVFNIIKYCKANNVNRDNFIDIGYSDLFAWYENVEGFDCLLTQDQNYEFLILAKGTKEIYVYKVKNIYKVKNMKPSLEDFANIVVPYLKELDKKWEEFLNGNLMNIKDCSIQPIVELSYYKIKVNNKTKIYKNTLLKANFDYFTDIKILNSLENQIEQFAIFIKENNN